MRKEGLGPHLIAIPEGLQLTKTDSYCAQSLDLPTADEINSNFCR